MTERDIVEQLRSLTINTHVARPAAAEIERLRAEVLHAYDDGWTHAMESATPADIGMVPVRRDETSGYMLWREATR